MHCAKVKSRRDVIDRVHSVLKELARDQKKMTKKLEAISELLSFVLTEPDCDMDGDIGMEENIRCKDNEIEECECDGVAHSIGDEVELMEPAKGHTCKAEFRGATITKFHETRVAFDVHGESTWRKHGNFCHVDGKKEASGKAKNE